MNVMSEVLIIVIYFCELSYSGDKCSETNDFCQEEKRNLYQEAHSLYLIERNNALQSYKEKNISCFNTTILEQLLPFKNGIAKKMLEASYNKGVKYQLIDHQLYRSKECIFPSRCTGVEYFIKSLKNELPDFECVINFYDWPQVNIYHGAILPVFSFSKTDDYVDIMYPAWSFWEGGPAIKIYPKGIGRWDLQRKTLLAASNQWPWEKKTPIFFFRGSRTSSERDTLILLSRKIPNLVNASYTKNQAWKSDKFPMKSLECLPTFIVYKKGLLPNKWRSTTGTGETADDANDTLGFPPAEEVPFEEHCQYKYLFNFRGVAASFRLKYLFLCKSLVLHVGDEWKEFFYGHLKPWIHYVPVKQDATEMYYRQLMDFIVHEDELVKDIAEKGFEFIKENLKMEKVLCYWKNLLSQYAKLLKFKPKLDKSLIRV